LRALKCEGVSNVVLMLMLGSLVRDRALLYTLCKLLVNLYALLISPACLVAPCHIAFAPLCLSLLSHSCLITTSFHLFTSRTDIQITNDRNCTAPGVRQKEIKHSSSKSINHCDYFTHPNHIILHIIPSDDGALRVSQVVKGEMQARTTFQRSAKGNISIKECAANGGAIVLENNQRRDENVSGWVIRRTCDGKEESPITFPKNTVIRGNALFKLVSDSADSQQRKDSDLDAGVEDFGTGGNITTVLINEKGVERASHIQKTTYK